MAFAPVHFLAGDWGCTELETDMGRPKVGGCHVHLDPTGEYTKNLRPVTALEVHIYMDIGRSREEYFQWLTNYDNGDTTGNRGQEFKQFMPTRHFNSATGVRDFTDSLQKKGAIVLYIGHGALGRTGNGPSEGLVPDAANHSEKDPPQIPNERLRQMLRDSKASLVIIAACDSVTAVGHLTGGPPVVVTDSGKKRLTQGGPMALAAAAFLFSLIGVELDQQRQPYKKLYGGHARIMRALDAANEMFASTREQSAFVLAGDDNSTFVRAGDYDRMLLIP